jgi:hypothetical protein
MEEYVYFLKLARDLVRKELELEICRSCGILIPFQKIISSNLPINIKSDLCYIHTLLLLYYYYYYILGNLVPVSSR